MKYLRHTLGRVYTFVWYTLLLFLFTIPGVIITYRSLIITKEDLESNPAEKIGIWKLLGYEKDHYHKTVGEVHDRIISLMYSFIYTGIGYTMVTSIMQGMARLARSNPKQATFIKWLTLLDCYVAIFLYCNTFRIYGAVGMLIFISLALVIFVDSGNG